MTRVETEIAAEVARKGAEIEQMEAEMHRRFSAPNFTPASYEERKRGHRG